MGVESASTRPDIQLLVRPGCHLCDVMEERLLRVLPTLGLTYRTVDVDTDAALRSLYGDVIPVLLVDGAEVARVRVSTRRLESLLDAPR